MRALDSSKDLLLLTSVALAIGACSDSHNSVSASGGQSPYATAPTNSGAGATPGAIPTEQAKPTGAPSGSPTSASTSGAGAGSTPASVDSGGAGGNTATGTAGANAGGMGGSTSTGTAGANAVGMGGSTGTAGAHAVGLGGSTSAGTAGSSASTGTAPQTDSKASLNSVAPSKLIGWAATDSCGPNGTTGGGDGPATVVVTSSAELQAALQAEGPAVIEVRGQMQGVRIKQERTASNKTLIGTNGAFISGGMRIDGGRNLIVRNIRFGEAKVVNGDDNLADGFTVHNTTCVWIDHCEFMNSIDGNLDLVGGDGAMTSWVTVSWSKFWYEADYATTTNPGHRFSNLIVGSDDEPDPLPYVTYHHNWWAENVTERMPRGRWARAHIFNNYYSTQGNNYGIGASVGIQYVVENNFFEPGFEDPVYFFNRDKGAAVRLSGNQLDGVKWVDTKPEDAAFGTPFEPTDFYTYTLQTPEEAKASVIAGAGVRP